MNICILIRNIDPRFLPPLPCRRGCMPSVPHNSEIRPRSPIGDGGDVPRTASNAATWI